MRAVEARFYDLYTRHHAGVRRFLVAMLGESEADDVAQDVFIKAYRALDTLPADANTAAWLFRVAHNAAIDRIRRRRLIAWVPIVGQMFHANEPDPADVVTTRDRVRAALGQLTPEQRAALVLREVAGLSYEEIATALGVSLGSVKMRLVRARESFRVAYCADDDDSPTKSPGD